MASAKSRAQVLAEAAEAQQGPLPEPPKGYRVRDTGFPLQKRGDVLTGTFKGPGPAKKIKGKKVPTFKVQRENGSEVAVLATYELAQFFGELKVGAKVWIRHDGQVKAGQFGRLTSYTTAVAPE